MWKRVRKNWSALTASPPGQRFRQYYHRSRRARLNRAAAASTLRSAIALVLIVLGVLMLIAPGPGIVLLTVGAAVFASESLAVARFLDGAEVWARHALRGLRR